MIMSKKDSLVLSYLAYDMYPKKIAVNGVNLSISKDIYSNKKVKNNLYRKKKKVEII